MILRNALVVAHANTVTSTKSGPATNKELSANPIGKILKSHPPSAGCASAAPGGPMKIRSKAMPPGSSTPTCQACFVGDTSMLPRIHFDSVSIRTLINPSDKREAARSTAPPPNPVRPRAGRGISTSAVLAGGGRGPTCDCHQITSSWLGCWATIRQLLNIPRVNRTWSAARTIAADPRMLKNSAAKTFLTLGTILRA